MEVSRKRLLTGGDPMGLLPQFEQTEESKIQNTLNQLGEDISIIKTNLEKKKPKITLSDISEKLDLIIHYLQSQ